MTPQQVQALTKSIAGEIISREDKVFVYVGYGYVLNMDGLVSAIREGIEKAAK